MLFIIKYKLFQHMLTFLVNKLSILWVDCCNLKKSFDRLNLITPMN